MGELSPAGWYPDPGGHGQRYWDGSWWTEHRHQPVPSVVSVAERTNILQQALVAATGPSSRIVAQSPTSAKISFGDSPNHVVHVLLVIFTCGLWIIPWAIVAIANPGPTTRTVVVDDFGQVHWH